MNSVFS